MPKAEVQTIIKPLLDYYKDRELKIAKLAYQKGATTSDMARALNITDAVASDVFPRNKLISGEL